MYYPTFRDLEIILDRMNKRYGISETIFNKGNLELAIEKPAIHLRGQKEQFPKLYQKAAVLMEAITKLHPFTDGNKRCGMMAAEFMVKVNGGELILPLKAIKFAVDVARDEDDLLTEEIKKWFEVHIAFNRNQLFVNLEEQFEEESILKTLLEDQKYEEAEKLVSWLAFDTYPEHKRAWIELVNNWKGEDKKISNKKMISSTQKKEAFDKWKSVIGIAKYDFRSLDLDLEKEVKNPDDLKFSGHSMKELEKYEKYRTRYEKSMKKNPRNIKKLHEQAMLLTKYGRYEEAIHCFGILVTLGKKNKREYIHELLHKTIILHQYLGRLEEAKKHYKKMLKLEPNDSQITGLLGRLLAEQGEHTKALKLYDKVLKIDPKDDYIWDRKGVSLDELGKYEESLKCFEMALEISPSDSEYMTAKATELTILGRMDESIDLFNKSLQINDKDRVTLYNLGLAYNKIEDTEKEMDCYRKVLELEPDHVKTLVNLGGTLTNIEKMSEALPHLKKALDLEPNHEIGLVNMGITLVKMNKFEDARIFFNRSQQK